MLNVSTAWKNMFDNNLISEALIKFVVDGYGTLYKTDIFKYEFNGETSAISNEYPKIEATIEMAMRPAYLNFSTFLNKAVDIYYGYIINGSEEYVKAITLYVDNIDVSDDGRVCYWTLKSLFAYMTDTITIQQAGEPTYTLTSFLSNQFSMGSYVVDGSRNFVYRCFPSRITLGETLQKLSFINGKSLVVDSNNKVHLKELDFTNFSSAVLFNEFNLLKYPHISKPEIINSISVIGFAESQLEDNLERKNVEDTLFSVNNAGGMSQGHRIYYGGYTFNTTDIENLYICQASIDWTPQPSGYDGVRVSFDLNQTNNEQIRFAGTAYDSTKNVSLTIDGYNYNNYIKTENGVFKVFDINITSATQKTALTTWLVNYTDGNQEIELNCRLNPAYELLDLVITNKNKKFVIEKYKMTFNGAYKGTLKGRYWGDGLFAPKVEIDHYSDSDYSLYIKNQNAITVDLYIEYSGGTLYFQLAPFENFYMDDQLYPQLMNSFQAKAYQDLRNEVYCWFENLETGEPTDNTIILEAD